MEISSGFTGTKLKTFRARVDPRMTMNYAAAINDNNPCYFDDRRENGLAAHPLFPVALTWKITGNIWDFIEADDFPMEALLTQIHHTEVIEHHRPLVPGDTLTIDGSIAAILPHRAGTRVVIRYEAVNGIQQPVFTEYCGALLRGVRCTDGGRETGKLPDIPEPGDLPDPLWSTAIDIDPLRPYLYDGCTDIFFPIHTSPKFAKEVGLPGIILQGTATLAFAMREIVNREAGREPTRIKMVSCRFTGMVLPGTCMIIHLLKRRDTPRGTAVFFEVHNSDGLKAVTGGYAVIERKN